MAVPTQAIVLPSYSGVKHQISIWALFLLPFVAIALEVIFWGGPFVGIMIILLHLVRGFGVTVGLHRLLTHRSFKCKPWVFYMLVIWGMVAVQGKAHEWAAIHRIHHKYSDHEGDPHSPIVKPEGSRWKHWGYGFLHAHYWWFRYGYPQSEINRMLKKELMDAKLMRISRMWLVWIALGFIIPALIGGVYFWLVGGSFLFGVSQGLIASAISVGIVGHTTFAINSICHLVGSKPYFSTDEARNVWLLAWITLGESYHHNHHVWEWMAFHGMGWWRDPSEIFIRTLMLFGLAWEPRMPKPEAVQAMRLKQIEATRQKNLTARAA